MRAGARAHEEKHGKLRKSFPFMIRAEGLQHPCLGLFRDLRILAVGSSLSSLSRRQGGGPSRGRELCNEECRGREVKNVLILGKLKWPGNSFH